MKKIRIYSWICALTAVLCSLSAISIGFATWAVTKDDINDSTHGSISADYIDSNIEGLSITSTVFTMGHYFFEEENASNELVHSETGDLIYTLTFSDVDSSCLINSTDIKLKITLNYTNDLTIFGDNLNGVYFDSSVSKETYSTGTSTSIVIFEKQFNVVSASTHTIKYEFNNLLVANYATAMAGGSFHLRLEALGQ